MRLSELINESTKIEYIMNRIPVSFWYNPDKPINEQIILATEEHVELIKDNPTAFGLTNNDIKNVKEKHKGCARETFDDTIQLAFNNGWVRGGKTVIREPNAMIDTLWLQSTNEKQCHKTAKQIREVFQYEGLILELENDYYATVSVLARSALKGDRLEYYLKHGKIPTKMVMENKL